MTTYSKCESTPTAICVTESRPKFMPWLLWNFNKQTIAHQSHLLIVDSSPRPMVVDQENVTILHAPGANIPQKRNVALHTMVGYEGAISWFDDDDWQHPQRLESAQRVLVDDTAVRVSNPILFYNLLTGQCSEYDSPHHPHFPGFDFVLSENVPLFDESKKRASDDAWVKAMISGGAAIAKTAQVMCLCHTKNISNPVERRWWGNLKLELDDETKRQIQMLKENNFN